MTEAATDKTPGLFLSSPEPGETLECKIQAFTTPVSVAVNRLARVIADMDDIVRWFLDSYGTRGAVIEQRIETSDPIGRAAWTIVRVYVLWRLAGGTPSGSTIGSSLSWFWKGCGVEAIVPQFPEICDEIVSTELDGIQFDDALSELLPYVFDPTGISSRSMILRGRSTKADRQRKRHTGTYGTPSDVASYIINQAAAEYPPGTCFRAVDPSCGAGVFLRLLLRRMVGPNREHVAIETVSYVYGVDIDVCAVEAAATVLAREILRLSDERVAPWQAWHIARANLVVADTITLDRPSMESADDSCRTENVENLREGLLPAATIRSDVRSSTDLPRSDFPLFGSKTVKLSQVFSEVGAGFDVLVGNPPYSRSHVGADASYLYGRFRSSGQTINGGNALPPYFIEQMWRLTDSDKGSAGLVVPLSLAFSSSGQYISCRNAISESGKHWKFSFYDREPHGLFGEEVKTRNVIALMYSSSHPGRTSIETTGLIRLTSRSRTRVLNDLHYHRIDSDISACIPKIGSRIGYRLFTRLKSEPRHFARCYVSKFRIAMSDTESLDKDRCVIVGSTAYNFLNVYHPLPIGSDSECELTSSKHTAMAFESKPTADAAFALLSSQLVFWWWVVTGDAFHVTSGFPDSIPLELGKLSDNERDSLSQLGHDLWQVISTQENFSKNKQRISRHFSPVGEIEHRKRIDEILLESVGMGPEAVAFLEEFVNRHILVDHTDERRHHIISSLVDRGRGQ